jgi:hypothetical protein
MRTEIADFILKCFGVKMKVDLVHSEQSNIHQENILGLGGTRESAEARILEVPA